MKLKIFALAYKEDQLSKIPNIEFIEKVDLSQLKIGDYQNNQFCEHRIYFSDLPENQDVEYLGFTTWRWNEKYPNSIKQECLNNLNLKINEVYCACLAENWVQGSMDAHLGMEPYLKELSEFTNLPLLYESIGFWSNNFICHKSVYLEFQKFFRRTFDHFNEKYKLNYNFEICEKDRNRHAGAFYERFSSLYFTNRKDLTLIKV